MADIPTAYPALLSGPWRRRKARARPGGAAFTAALPSGRGRIARKPEQRDGALSTVRGGSVRPASPRRGKAALHIPCMHACAVLDEANEGAQAFQTEASVLHLACQPVYTGPIQRARGNLCSAASFCRVQPCAAHRRPRQKLKLLIQIFTRP